MLGRAIVRAARDVLSPPFRAVLWKTLGLTAAALVALWFGIEALAARVVAPWAGAYLPALPAWAEDAETVAGWAAGLGLAVGLVFLIGPVSAAIAGLFLDDVAEVTERQRYAEVPPGQAVPWLPALWLSLRFFGIVVAGNLLAFVLLLVPGVNLVAFFAVNGYLIGREYFTFAAMRYRTEAEARAMRRRHRGVVFAAGAVVALLLAVPVLNLLAPLFAAGLMVNLHQLLSRASGERLLPSPSATAGSGRR